jgi:hypothetical protein
VPPVADALPGAADAVPVYHVPDDPVGLSVLADLLPAERDALSAAPDAVPRDQDGVSDLHPHGAPPAGDHGEPVGADTMRHEHRPHVLLDDAGRVRAPRGPAGHDRAAGDDAVPQADDGLPRMRSDADRAADRLAGQADRVPGSDDLLPADLDRLRRQRSDHLSALRHRVHGGRPDGLPGEPDDVPERLHGLPAESDLVPDRPHQVRRRPVADVVSGEPDDVSQEADRLHGRGEGDGLPAELDPVPAHRHALSGDGDGLQSDRHGLSDSADAVPVVPADQADDLAAGADAMPRVQDDLPGLPPAAHGVAGAGDDLRAAALFHPMPAHGDEVSAVPAAGRADGLSAEADGLPDGRDAVSAERDGLSAVPDARADCDAATDVLPEGLDPMPAGADSVPAAALPRAGRDGPAGQDDGVSGGPDVLPEGGDQLPEVHRPPADGRGVHADAVPDRQHRLPEVRDARAAVTAEMDAIPLIGRRAALRVLPGEQLIQVRNADAAEEHVVLARDLVAR